MTSILLTNDTNRITLSHLHQKISRLTNNGKNSVFWPTSCTFDVMTCHVKASWCHICQNVSPIPSNRYAEAIFAIGIIKKVTGEKRQGGGIHPPGRPRVKESISKSNRFLKNRYSNPTDSWRIDIRTQPILEESIFEPNRFLKNRHPNPKISLIDFWAWCGTVRRQLKDVAQYWGNLRMWHGTEATGEIS